MKAKPEPGLFDALEPARPRESHTSGRFVHVALDRPLREDLTYRLPAGMAAAPGTRVEVPLGVRREVGVVVGESASTALDPNKIRPILRALDARPLLDRDLLDLSSRVAREWICSRGQALAAMLPASLRRDRARRLEVFVVLRSVDPEVWLAMESKEPDRFRVLRTLREAGGELPMGVLLKSTKLSTSPVRTLERRGLVRLDRRPAGADPLLLVKGVAPSVKPKLNDEQAAAVEAIASAAVGRTFTNFLLFGITGSGKTEVYLHALERALAAGRGGIVLVPEIALTPQMVERFRARFRDVAVLHSHLTDAERMDQWRSIREGRARVVVGARSAIFAPVADLGLVIVDEEHEPSFKQGSTPRYHARDVARMRGEFAGAAVVLGSATPSLETWKRAQEGSIRMLRLGKRVAGGELPNVRIADLRLEKAKDLGLGAGVEMTRPLRSAIAGALERKEKVILFLNRRGFAPVLWCSNCGKTVSCSRCAISLTLHKRIEKMVCHMCAREAAVPQQCPSCGAARPRFLGAGTERIEQLMLRAFPKAHVARMDSDTTIARGSHEAILDRFRHGNIDVLVGTQMIAKGLDIAEVTVVGVVNADATLHIPEYHSSERAFQLVAQVAGRAGRAAAGGQVIVQTALPTHPAIECAARHDFEGFARGELAERERHRYPPFVRLVRVLVEDAREERAKLAIEEAVAPFRNGAFEGIEVLGPVPAPIPKIKGKLRWHFLLRCDPPARLEAARERLAELALRSFGGVRASVDVDPSSTL